jgi:hypothetical protein
MEVARRPGSKRLGSLAACDLGKSDDTIGCPEHQESSRRTQPGPWLAVHARAEAQNLCHTAGEFIEARLGRRFSEEEIDRRARRESNPQPPA